MKKLKVQSWISLFLVVCMCIIYFAPFISEVKAEGNSYQVTVLKTDGNTENLGTYTSYNEAKYKMQAHSSTGTEVAVIYKDGKIVNANYAIAKFIPGSVAPLYPSSSSNTKYTSTATSYGTDAAFLDYDDASGRAQIKISGYTGWVSINYLNVVPLSDLQASTVKILADISIRVRRSPSLSGEQFGNVKQGEVYRYYEKTYADGYTWYRIKYNGEDGWIASASNWTSESVNNSLQTFYEPYSSSGNLIHYFEYYSGSDFKQSFTNLGPNPNYLRLGVSYYSFDGNYFYEHLTRMLDDYKSNTYEHAINKDTPFFGYYLYLSNHSNTSYEAEDLNNILVNTYKYYRGPEPGVTYVDEYGNWISGLDRSGMSVMYNQGSAFLESQSIYGVNALLTFSAALNESAKGTSALSFAKNNIFGHGAVDDSWFSSAYRYDTVKDSIFYHAKLTGGQYNNPNHSYYYGGHYGNKASGMNVLYATDPYWGEKMAGNYYSLDSYGGKQDYLANTTGVKLSEEAVFVYAEPSTSSKVLYTLKNKSTNVSNMPMTVTDKVTVNGQTFYKIKTDIGVDENKNITPDSYNVQTSFGYVEVNKLYVENKQPSIHANDIVVNFGESPDYWKDVVATDPEDGNITDQITIIQNDVNLKEPGVYKITYRVEDKSRFGVEKTVQVTVKGSNAPTIEANDQMVSQYTEFDAKKGIKAFDYDGTDITSLLRVEGSVNTAVKGSYELTYSVTNALGKTTTKTIIITVKENEKPVIHASDRTIKINSIYDPLEGVRATDLEDGDLTSAIQVKFNQVNSKEAGDYQVIYEVTDQAGNVTIKEITVTVSDRESKNGEFYFEYLKNENGQLKIKGFQTIEGIQNTLDTEIHYQVIFTNEETNEQYRQTLHRITNEADMPFEIESSDGIQYKYAWFEGVLDIDELTLGNYSLSIMAYSPEYFATNPISNVFGFTMESTYQAKDHSVLIRNNYESREAPIQFFVRNDLIGEKNATSKYNIENEYYKIAYFDGKLNIRGASHIIGGDYAENREVKREIVLEEIHTYQRYRYEVGSITDGDYPIELRVPDGKDKTRAWFDAFLNVSNLEKGVYAIYISTSSNLSDFGELRDIFANPIHTTWEQDGKTYSLRVVKEKRYRIELIVE